MTRPIATPATGDAQRHAGVHERERTAADRRHRRRAVRLEDVRDDADRVREVLLAGQERDQRALGQRTVTDLAPAGTAEELHFADRERREVVVEHEALVRLAVHRLDLLRVVLGAERRADERLRLAAREHRRAVGAGEDADLDGDRADLVEAPAVEPLAALEDLVAHDLLFQVLEDLLRVRAPLDLLLGDARDQLGQDLIHRPVVLELVLDSHRLGERNVRPSPRPPDRSRGRSP